MTGSGCGPKFLKICIFNVDVLVKQVEVVGALVETFVYISSLLQKQVRSHDMLVDILKNLNAGLS